MMTSEMDSLPLRFSPLRPPVLGPRRRRVPSDVEHRLRAWVEEAAGSSARACEVHEWMSLDHRTVPHVVSIWVERAGARERLVIEKACERIGAADVRAALASPSHVLNRTP